MEEHSNNTNEKEELDLFAAVVDFNFKRGWLTENEKLRVILKTTLIQRKAALLDLVNTMKCETNSARLFRTIKCTEEVDVPSNWGSTEDKNNLLSVIISSLFQDDLITEEEKLEFERQLLVETTENGNSIENVTCDDAPMEVELEVEGNELSTDNIAKNPLKINLVIKCILKYMNVEEIKICRYISTEWAFVALEVLATRSVINFTSRKTGVPDKTPLEFFQVFPDTFTDIVPFSHFSIYKGHDSPMKIEDLNYFFERQGKFITTLEWTAAGRWEKVMTLDITPWLLHTSVNKRITIRETKLVVNASASMSPVLSLDLESVRFVKYLYLFKCDINIQDGIRMSPMKLLLSFVTITNDGKALTEFCVNNILDFSNIKFLCLNTGDEEDRKYIRLTRLSLDLDANEKLNLDYLELRNITIKNWKTCSWIVNSFHLRNTPYLEKTKMQVKELYFSDSDIDLNLLPQCLEKLFIEYETCLCSQSIILQNLKSLYIFLLDDFVSTFEQNFGCPNLVNLTLEGVGGDEIDAEWIPQTVKILKLSRVKVKNVRNMELNLDKLILKTHLPVEAKDMLNSRFRTKELVLHFPYNSKVSPFMELLEFQKNSLNSCQRIYSGEFDWKRNDDLIRPDSPLRNCVQREAQCYVFENQMGKPIYSQHFMKLFNNNWYSPSEDE